MADWPTERINRSTFDKLPEYSTSLPSKTTIGKVWKRRQPWYADASVAEWLICEYVELSPPVPNRVGIDVRRAEIIAESL